MRRLVIAGVTSGVGKTTIACALMAALARRGRRVQPFKVGPDYIDPSHHTAAAGRPSRNLDSVLLPPPALRALFDRAARGVDVSIVEGVMGLFDGRAGHGEEGSTAHVAKLLEAPVVVVIDAARTSRTAGAIALGCVRFDPDLRIVGFILNRVGSDSHARSAADAVEAATGLPVLGAVPRDQALATPERHLGLVPTTEQSLPADFVERLAATAERHLDLDRLWQLALDKARTPVDNPFQEREGAASRLSLWERPAPFATADKPGEGDPGSGAQRGGISSPRPIRGEQEFRPPLFPERPMPKQATIAIARDAAFNFYYQDSLDLLHAWGAELATFSPLADRALPPGTQGVYIGGGFPELFAAELAENESMRAALQAAAAAELPIYGECGGLMYLGRSLTDFDGRSHTMVGIVPLDSIMQRRGATLGYRTVTALRASPLMNSGAEAMGHEFHYSELATPPPAGTAAYSIAEAGGAPEGYAHGGVLVSYVHLHFGSDPAMARRFIRACAQREPASTTGDPQLYA